MGNAWFGKKRSTKAAVHPVVQGVTITVRMTRAQLHDLSKKVDMISNGNSELLGRLIVQECSKGRFHACVVAATDGDGSQRPNMYPRVRGLNPIQENIHE